MNCVDMIDSLNNCIESSDKKYFIEQPLKKRKRDENIIQIKEKDYTQTMELFNEMNKKIAILEEKIKYLEDDNTKKNELLNNINKNYLTKESIKKIKIYSNFELSEYDYYS